MKKVGIDRKKPSIVTLDSIEPKETVWLWYPYIPIGTITAIFGRGGMGKSYLTCDIAARLSTGRALPDSPESKIPQKILMLSAEDDYAQVLVPRLIKLGADLRNIAVPSEQFTLSEWGVEQIGDLMRDFAATVVFIDPLVYYAGGKMDMNKSNEVRALMEKLKTMADQSKSAVIVVGHVRKSQEGGDADQMMGSADWINASRSGLLVTKTNDGTSIMKHAKTNYGMLGLHRGFNIDDNGFEWTETFADDQIAKKSSGRKDQAIAFLKTVLASGPVLASEIEKFSRDEGISMPTLNRAKIGIAESFFNKNEKKFYWRLAA